MTDLDVAPTAAGWYPDPEGAAATRFWDGSAWTIHTKGGAARFAPPTAATPVQPGHIAPMTGVPRNSMATAGLVLGIVSLLFNLLLIPTILGVVFGSIGAARAGRRGGVGRARAIVGIVLSGVGVLAIGIQVAIAIPLFIGLQHGASVATVQATVARQAAQQGTTFTSIDCPPTADLTRAGTFACDATKENGRHDMIVVTVAPDRSWSWTARAVG